MPGTLEWRTKEHTGCPSERSRQKGLASDRKLNETSRPGRDRITAVPVSPVAFGFTVRFASLTVWLSGCLSVCSFVRLFVCLFVCGAGKAQQQAWSRRTMCGPQRKETMRRDAMKWNGMRRWNDKMELLSCLARNVSAIVLLLLGVVQLLRQWFVLASRPAGLALPTNRRNLCLAMFGKLRARQQNANTLFSTWRKQQQRQRQHHRQRQQLAAETHELILMQFHRRRRRHCDFVRFHQQPASNLKRLSGCGCVCVCVAVESTLFKKRPRRVTKRLCSLGSSHKSLLSSFWRLEAELDSTRLDWCRTAPTNRLAWPNKRRRRRS